MLQLVRIKPMQEKKKRFLEELRATMTGKPWTRGKVVYNSAVFRPCFLYSLDVWKRMPDPKYTNILGHICHG